MQHRILFSFFFFFYFLLFFFFVLAHKTTHKMHTLPNTLFSSHWKFSNFVCTVFVVSNIMRWMLYFTLALSLHYSALIYPYSLVSIVVSLRRVTYAFFNSNIFGVDICRFLLFLVYFAMIFREKSFTRASNRSHCNALSLSLSFNRTSVARCTVKFMENKCNMVCALYTNKTQYWYVPCISVHIHRHQETNKSSNESASSSFLFFIYPWCCVIVIVIIFGFMQNASAES